MIADIFIVVLILVVLMSMLGAGSSESSSEDCSLDTHRLKGRFRVLYEDGFLSQPFMIETAKFYAKHFGGTVVSRDYMGPYRILPDGRWVNNG